MSLLLQMERRTAAREDSLKLSILLAREQGNAEIGRLRSIHEAELAEKVNSFYLYFNCLLLRCLLVSWSVLILSCMCRMRALKRFGKN